MAVRRMLVAGRYRLHEPVGTGGMGRVWLARDEMLDRDVAIKEFVPPDWMTYDERDKLRVRTLREARSAARLNNPHVVKIYDVVHAEGLPWIVMEYVQSRSLQQVLREDGPLDPPTAALIGLHVLDGLTAAHRAGVLHRDVKPHNVLIGAGGRVVLTDFGLARSADDGGMTHPGLVVGSPQYVSPERARDGTSTVESDMWSLGATIYAAVEGRSPYARASSMATLLALATEAPDPVRRAGPLEPVITGLLRHEPRDRLPGPAVAEGLRRVLHTGEPRLPRPPAVTAGPPTAPADRGRVARQATAPGVGRAAVPVPRRPDDAGEVVVLRHRAPEGEQVRALPSGQSPADPGSAFPVPSQAVPSAPMPAGPRVAEPAGPPDIWDADRGGLETGPDRPGGADPGRGAEPTDHVPATVFPVTLIPTSLPARPTRARRWMGRSRWFVAGALVAGVLVSTGGVLLDRLADAGNRPRPPVAGSSPGPTTGAPAGGTAAGVGGFGPQVCEPSNGGNLPRTPRPGARRTAFNGYALPDGWSYHRDRAGFGIAVPDGWTYQRIGTIVCFRDPDGVRVLSIDFARSPAADPVRACRREAARLVKENALPGYDQIGIDAVLYFGKAADWEYRYRQPKGVALHANTRWFAADARAYAIGWVTREFDWRVNRANLDMIMSSFSPART
jgi:eukaryotic-like serine/threonine-protein kinase